MCVIYKFTYPNGKIYIGKDLTDALDYRGTISSSLIANDFTQDERKDMILGKEILWDSNEATDKEVNQKVEEYIRKYKSDDRAIGYNHFFYHPDWLYRRIIEDELPWDKKSGLTLETFFEKYSLHDAQWIGIFHNVALDASVTLALILDTVWLPAETTFDGVPFLFIQVDRVDQISLANFSDFIGPRDVSNVEFEIMDGKKILAIDDIYGGQVNIIFSGDVSIVALDENETVLDL
jgi:hypothetical protein